MEFPEISPTNQKEITCKGCSAGLQFKPGTRHLQCPYCGMEQEIAASVEQVRELDLLGMLGKVEDSADTYEVVTVNCDACNARTTFSPGVVADACPFCGKHMTVTKSTSNRIIKPASLLPFKILRSEADSGYQQWLKSLWFAPGDLQQFARREGRLSGMYIPYWTYDADTVSKYHGERGDDYDETETYTTVENGNQVTKTRTVTKTRWHSVSGRVREFFNDILILAGASLPKKYADRLAPWDLENLVPFDDKFLTGFSTESYQITLREGFQEAKSIMEDEIHQLVCRDIGGDHQRVQSINTRYHDLTFKHILLPVWISAYRYRNTVYRMLINARTGEVQGERPYSWIKITLFILACVALVAGAIEWYDYYQTRR
ncbi:MAG: hypothetical protein OEZ39_02480 [Gammaproteobacteria bacterium]|nr:hypothetical protein [Gammaproteobacteria bacterium]MDH5650721.1 hypothetical protein [Gammaproteobacteria bacterium]